CHRKLLPGKKMMELLVERVVSCENLQDCCRACDYEKTFACKGFNHRRRTDDSKCICELTSTPHFRMDVDEDFSVDSHYDYYEKNQNCLPSTFDPVKNYEPSGRNMWSDRVVGADKDHFYREIYSLSNSESTRDYPNGLAQPNQQFNYEEPRGGKYNIRFASRQNAPLNWNHKWRNSDVTNGNTLPNSPLNYDKEYVDYVRSSIFSKSPIEQDPSPEHGFSLPDQHEHFYGKFYNYGGAFGYNDNSCATKAVAGSKLGRSVLRKTCLAHDFDQCEDLCINETSFSCQSFAYRYNVLTANPTDNCLLSDLSYRDLNFYTDLEPDRDYDSYIFMPDDKICDLKKSTNRYPAEECFSRVRSGFTMPMDITNNSMFVNDLGECQFACTASQQFLCRSFVFNYAVNSRGRNHQHVPFNCFLSDWPTEEMNPTNMPDMDGAELYERNTFSYGCEIYPSTSLSFPHVTIPNDKRFSSMHTTDELCYSEHHRPCKLMSHAIVSSMRALTKSECRRKCSTMRNTAAIPCMSFNYLINIDGTRDNCFLSDISRRDLRPNLDYVRDNDHILYTWKEFDPLCGITPAFEKHAQSSSPSSSSSPLLPMLNDLNTQRTLDSGSHIYRPILHSSTTRWENKFRSENHQHNYKHELTNGDDKSNSGGSEYQLNFLYCEPSIFSTKPIQTYMYTFCFAFDRLASQLSPFRRYTVNGNPCRNGTVCQRNEITGFWSCETENEYGGSWDYCCEPNHQCGFSQGYHYPWCYVGSNEDQWRPCSETYNPYYSPKDRSIYRQSPLYTARHWPVIYFHETSPPNCSTNDP
ncbi:hypothetical protein WH47_09010, partial [Habropoda laboriosa]